MKLNERDPPLCRWRALKPSVVARNVALYFVHTHKTHGSSSYSITNTTL